MRDILVFIIVFGVIPFALARPYIGVLLWSWLGYMNPHRLTFGFAYHFDFVKFAAAATLIGLLFSKEKKTFPFTPLTIIWLLFVIWMCITTIFALNSSDAFRELERTIKIQTLMLVTLILLNNKERIIYLVWVIALSIGFFGIKGGIFTILTGGNFRVWGPPGSFIFGNNEIALALLIVIPLMRFLQLSYSNKWVKRGLSVSMLLMLAAAVGSYSRGAFLAGGMMLLFLWLKSRAKLGIMVIIVLTIGISWYLMPAKWFDRMETIETYQSDESAMGRINAWWFAYNLANERPITGGGFQAFSPDLFQLYAPNPESVHDAHSIYFEVLAEQGYIGLILFLLMGIMVLSTGRWIIKNCSGYGELQWASDLAAMLQVSFVGYAVGGAFLGLAYFDLPYHLMTIMVATQTIVLKAMSEKKI